MRRIELFRACGRLASSEYEAFGEADWVSSMLNFGLVPDAWNPLADMADEKRVAHSLKSFREAVAATAQIFAAGTATAWPARLCIILIYSSFLDISSESATAAGKSRLNSPKFLEQKILRSPREAAQVRFEALSLRFFRCFKALPRALCLFYNKNQKSKWPKLP